MNIFLVEAMSEGQAEKVKLTGGVKAQIQNILTFFSRDVHEENDQWHITWFTRKQWRRKSVRDRVTSLDVVLYFTTDSSVSVIQSVANRNRTCSDAAGCTDPNPPQISEIYVSGNFPPRKLANIAFHELIHNKTRMTNAQLHNHESKGLTQSPTLESHQLTEGNVKLLKPFLAKHRRQFAQPV